MGAADKLLERFTPWYGALEVAPPKAREEEQSRALEAFIDEAAPLEQGEAQAKRQRLLVELQDMLNKWVMRKLEEKHAMFQGDVETEVAGKLFVSGSYRLGVNTRGTDIDSICTIPIPLTRDEFFSEEDGMVALLRKRPEVTYVNAVTGARVPIIEVVWDEIELDVLCAIVQRGLVPQTPEELLDDKILIGMDEASQITLNGPRVTELMALLVPNMKTFKLALRCVRYWAKQRGLYSNKIGFLGGVNWALLVAFVCQLFPSAAPSTLLRQFFYLYKSWKWPTEIRLCHPYEVEGMDARQWEAGRTQGEVCPIITPAYPCMNSSYTVSKYTLRIMLNEFSRGFERCKGAENEKSVSADNWAPLFKSHEFFLQYATYIVIKATCPEEDMLNRWSGWVEARIRRLLDELDRFSMNEIYPYPKRLAHDGVVVPADKLLDAGLDDGDEDSKEDGSGADPAADKAGSEQQEKEAGDDAATTKKKKRFGCYWYVGIKPHPINSVRQGSTIDMSSAVASWCATIKSWPERVDGMEVAVALTKWKDLPDDPDVFPEGKSAAKARHKWWVQRTKAENARVRQQVQGSVMVDEAAAAAEKAAEEAASKEASSNAATNLSPDKTVVKKKEQLEGSEDDAHTGAVKGEIVSDGEAVDKGEDAQNNIERMQQVLHKRAREEKEVTEASEKVRNVSTNFHELPRVPGIDTTRPVKFHIWSGNA